MRAFYPTAKLPESEADLRAQYMSLLHGRRALLLMDNAAGREQVERLIPPESCILLVTSRVHFTLPGLYAKKLDTLSPEDSRELLLKIAGRIGDSADEIARLCGYLPLALRLAASALAERENLSAKDYVRRLSGAQKRLELVDASLTLSYELLNPEQQKLWRTLAVFPDTFDARAAAAVWELDADAAQDALGDLVRYSLLEWAADTQRYRLHDLARIFAESRTGDDESHATHLRHAAHYLTVLRECDALYLKGSDAMKSGLALFDVDGRSIETGQDWARRQVSKDGVAVQLCNEYPVAGMYILSLRQHPRDSISWSETALAAARILKDSAFEASHLTTLGNAYKDLGEMRRAIELYEQALVIAREVGDRGVEGSVLGNLGVVYRNLGETRRAIEFHEQSLLISREIGDRRNEGQDLGNLGNAYAELGEMQRAIQFYEQVLVASRELGDRRGEEATLGNLGIVYLKLGDVHQAIEFFEQQRAIACEIGDRFGEGMALFNTGLALDTFGDRAKAITHAEAALELYEQIESPHAEGVRDQIAAWRGEG